MLPRRWLLIGITPVILIVTGTVGFHVIEGLELFDALYLTVMTLTTVGFGDIVPNTEAGKLFTMALALGGIFTLFVTTAEILRAIISGEFQAALGRQRMEQSLAGMKNHLVICGYGRMGMLVAREFSAQHLNFVVVDNRAEALENFRLPHGISLVGDATSDEVLRHAGVDRARALVTVAGSDADNLYITMSARLLNEKLFIVARAENEPTEQKLIRAGANRVVSPYTIGGQRVAHAVLRPTVVDFIELATRSEHLELQLEETRISKNSALVGVTLNESGLRQQLGIILVAIKKSTGQMIFNPPADSVLDGGDILISLGPRLQLDKLDALAEK
ncbi:MAG: TrkA family potassium uptake protein [Gemmataceae bacterium]